MRISFVSLNIEQDKHLDVVSSFLKQKEPDIICLQEVMEWNIPLFRDATGTNVVFAPMFLFPTRHGDVPLGSAIFSRHPLRDQHVIRYAGNHGVLRQVDHASSESMYATMQYTLAVASVIKEGALFRIATTQFPWTLAGSVTDFQHEATTGLIRALGQEREIILCGDFNAPRPGQIFSIFAQRWTDNIPACYKTSLDVSLHRSGKERPHELADKMVDGLFTTAGYHAMDVELVSGVSDHCAVLAQIEKTP